MAGLPPTSNARRVLEARYLLRDGEGRVRETRRHVDNAGSKTIDLPPEAGVEEVTEIYRRAWELDLKGITIFRSGSKGRQVLERGTGDDGPSPDD